MELKEKLSFLEKSNEFINWKKGHKGSYLAHVFRMFDEANKDVWQFGYYNADDKISTFFVERDSVKEVPEQNIFKKENVAIPKLEIENVEIDFDAAMEKVAKIHEEKYKQHTLMKSFAILQTIEGKQVYNITLVTQTFNTLNVRIDTKTGEIIREKLTSLMDLAKFERGGRKDPDENYIG